MFGFLLLSSAPAETKVFETYHCSIELADEVSWTILKPDQITKKETFFAAVSPDSSNFVSIAFQKKPSISSDKAGEEYLAGVLFGMKKSGFTVTNKVKQDCGKYKGYLVTSKGLSNGYESIQSTWTIFTPLGTYTVNSGMLEFSEEAAKLSGKILTTFRLIP